MSVTQQHKTLLLQALILLIMLAIATSVQAETVEDRIGDPSSDAEKMYEDGTSDYDVSGPGDVVSATIEDTETYKKIVIEVAQPIPEDYYEAYVVLNINANNDPNTEITITGSLKVGLALEITNAPEPMPLLENFASISGTKITITIPKDMLGELANTPWSFHGLYDIAVELQLIAYDPAKQQYAAYYDDVASPPLEIEETSTSTSQEEVVEGTQVTTSQTTSTTTATEEEECITYNQAGRPPISKVELLYYNMSRKEIPLGMIDSGIEINARDPPAGIILYIPRTAFHDNATGLDILANITMYAPANVLQGGMVYSDYGSVQGPLDLMASSVFQAEFPTVALTHYAAIILYEQGLKTINVTLTLKDTLACKEYTVETRLILTQPGEEGEESEEAPATSGTLTTSQQSETQVRSIVIDSRPLVVYRFTQGDKTELLAVVDAALNAPQAEDMELSIEALAGEQVVASVNLGSLRDIISSGVQQDDGSIVIRKTVPGQAIYVKIKPLEPDDYSNLEIEVLLLGPASPNGVEYNVDKAILSVTAFYPNGESYTKESRVGYQLKESRPPQEYLEKLYGTMTGTTQSSQVVTPTTTGSETVPVTSSASTTSQSVSSSNTAEESSGLGTGVIAGIVIAVIILGIMLMRLKK